MPNISLQPEQVRLIYWIAVSVLAFFVLLFIVKVALDETKEEPNDFLKRYTLFLFLSWCLLGLWFAPAWFPQYFRAITGKSHTRSVQRSNQSQSAPAPDTRKPENTQGDESTDEVTQTDVANSDSKASHDTDAMDSDTSDASSETENARDDENDSEEQPKKEIDPRVMQRIRADKS